MKGRAHFALQLGERCSERREVRREVGTGVALGSKQRTKQSARKYLAAVAPYAVIMPQAVGDACDGRVQAL